MGLLQRLSLTNGSLVPVSQVQQSASSLYDARVVLQDKLRCSSCEHGLMHYRQQCRLRERPLAQQGICGRHKSMFVERLASFTMQHRQCADEPVV